MNLERESYHTFNFVKPSQCVSFWAWLWFERPSIGFIRFMGIEEQIRWRLKKPDAQSGGK